MTQEPRPSPQRDGEKPPLPPPPPPRKDRGSREDLAYALQIAKAEIERLTAERDEARRRLLSAAGDDLCRLSPEEIKSMASGVVQIPPKEEFLASCERFHSQVAGEAGVLTNCLTLAQLIAENERLRAEVENAKGAYRRLHNSLPENQCEGSW